MHGTPFFAIMPVTILDIAKATGKSFSTVSRALSASGRISEETRRLIQEAAHRMGYHPSFAGTALQKGRTNTLGVLVPEIGTPFYADVIHYLQEYAAEDGFDISIFTYDFDPVKERRCLKKLLTGICDGVVGFPTSMEHIGAEVETLWQAHVPFVGIGLPDSDKFPVCYDRVNVDRTEATLEILAILKRHGKRHIVKVEEQITCELSKHMEQGFLWCLNEAGFPHDAANTFHHTFPVSNFAAREGMEMIQQIFAAYPDTDVIFAWNGPQLYGMLAGLRTLNRRVPEDLMFVTCDDTWLTHYAPVPVLSIDQRLDLVVRRAYDMFFDRIKSKKWNPPRSEFVTARLSNRYFL